jgi:penicillin-binding protein 1A
LHKATPLVTPDNKALAFKVIEAPVVALKKAQTLEPVSIGQESLGSSNLEQIALSTRANSANDNASIIEASETFIVELESLPATRVLDERIVYMMNSIMRDVVKRGTGRRALVLGRDDLAGKTGTTNGPIDAWFSGFNDHTVTTTWVGFDDNKKLGRGEYGGISALPIWVDYMRVALAGVPETIRPQPNGIVTIRVNADTGERARLSDPNGIYELFLKENAPAELQDIETITIDANTVAPEDLF